MSEKKEEHPNSVKNDFRCPILVLQKKAMQTIHETKWQNLFFVPIGRYLSRQFASSSTQLKGQKINLLLPWQSFRVSKIGKFQRREMMMGGKFVMEIS